MPFLFESNDVHNVLDNKRLVLMGCSNVRAIYKDLICLHQYNEFISNEILRQKMENSCFGTSVSFYFLTKIYSGYVERILADMAIDSAPDVIIASSCLWDITRWGPNGVEEYKANLQPVLRPPEQNTALYIAGHLADSSPPWLRMSATADRYGIDVIDIHYHLRMFLEYRAEDGIHWLPKGVRLCTNLVLTHIALSWGSNGSPCDSFLVDSEKKLIEDERRHFRCIPDEEIPSQPCRSEEQPLTTADRWDEEFITYGNNDVNEAPPSQRPKAQRGNWRARRYFRPRKNWWRRTWLRGKRHAAAKASRAQQSE
ncbi:hypothetical protein MRX96_032318 [Rhipicephalus microplus]